MSFRACLRVLLQSAALVCSAHLVSARAIDAERARDLLTRLLSSNDAARSAARLAIARSGEAPSFPPLVDALFFAPADGRSEVVACLEALSGERLGPQYKYWFEYVGGQAPGGPRLPRIPGHRAFWFAWYAFFPQTAVYEGCTAADPGRR